MFVSSHLEVFWKGTKYKQSHTITEFFQTYENYSLYYRVSSQDQIAHLNKEGTYLKDLMLNHTFQVIQKRIVSVHSYSGHTVATVTQQQWSHSYSGHTVTVVTQLQRSHSVVVRVAVITITVVTELQWSHSCSGHTVAMVIKCSGHTFTVVTQLQWSYSRNGHKV